METRTTAACTRTHAHAHLHVRAQLSHFDAPHKHTRIFLHSCAFFGDFQLWSLLSPYEPAFVPGPNIKLPREEA
jgi:hypothetical protein